MGLFILCINKFNFDEINLLRRMEIFFLCIYFPIRKMVTFIVDQVLMLIKSSSHALSINHNYKRCARELEWCQIWKDLLHRFHTGETSPWLGFLLFVSKGGSNTHLKSLNCCVGGRSRLWNVQICWLARAYSRARGKSSRAESE